MNPLKIVGCVFIVLIIFLVSISIGEKVKDKINENKSLKRTLEYYDSTYLIKRGGTTFFLENDDSLVKYDIRSWDAGKHWYAVEDNDSGFIILGDAEKIYPGLLKNLELRDSLVKLIEINK
jgi:hypothetical protein